MAWAIWITGLPGSGKSTLAREAAVALAAAGLPVTVLELDEIRRVLTPAPTYSDAERELVYRALAYMAKLLTEAGVSVLIDATAHRRAWRDLARRLVPAFAEVQLSCPLEVCRAREAGRERGHAPRGIYARSGAPGAAVPGVDVAYEPAVDAELVIDTGAEDGQPGVRAIVDLARGLQASLDRARPATPEHAPPPHAPPPPRPPLPD